ncbi:MAG: methionyl-tRNA formyltransferase [Proteobacteria bacterium]|nr:MAG: methionyl-tRNA formyltransferase [Pseudomonadota bacterium]
MRLVYMGSPSEVIAPLESLIKHCQESGDQLVAVVSQPAKPAGRKQTLTDPPVAAFAKEQGLLCLQPIKASDPLFLDELRNLNVDVIITAAYGQILSNAFLAIPKRATINIHPSLLPAYRGAIPVPAALLDGLETTGVTVLFTVKALDAGNIILQKTFPIDPSETAGALTPRLFAESSTLLFEALDKLRDQGFVGDVQDESRVTLCRKIAKTDGAIDWKKDSKTIVNEFRAYQPWPGSYTEREKLRVTVEEMTLIPSISEQLNPGEFYFDKKEKAIIVGTGDSPLAIKRLKNAGSKSVDAASFWNGLKLTGKGQFEVVC